MACRHTQLDCSSTACNALRCRLCDQTHAVCRALHTEKTDGQTFCQDCIVQTGDSSSEVECMYSSNIHLLIYHIYAHCTTAFILIIEGRRRQFTETIDMCPQTAGRVQGNGSGWPGCSISSLKPQTHFLPDDLHSQS